jgi:glycosyltransferase involved in cell wall biosynthesis
MKVLAISHSCAADVNQQLYVSLRRLPRMEVELVVPAHWRDGYSRRAQPPRLLPGVDFPVHALPVTAPGQTSLHFYRSGLAQTIRAAQADIVFADEEPWSLALAQVSHVCRRLQIPFVCYTKQNIYKRLPLPFGWIEQRTYANAAAIIALSEEVRSVLRRKRFHGQCPLLAHGCDLSLFYERDSKDLRRSLGLRGTVIGYMGRLVPCKGLDTLIQAIAQLLQEGPNLDVQVVLVGSGPQESDLRRAISAARLESRFVFTGAVPHIRAGEYMSCMDIFVLPSRTDSSWKEQFGRVLIEALACGVPVVGSTCGQIPYLIRDTGGGSVFREGDAADLARKLLPLIRDTGSRRDLGRLGREKVRSLYTYEAIASQLHAILKAAARHPPSAVSTADVTDGPGNRAQGGWR